MLCLVSMERERFSEGADKVPCLPGNLLDVGAVTPNGKESSAQWDEYSLDRLIGAGHSGGA